VKRIQRGFGSGRSGRMPAHAVHHHKDAVRHVGEYAIFINGSSQADMSDACRSQSGGGIHATSFWLN
jgi:hypothetical protein